MRANVDPSFVLPEAEEQADAEMADADEQPREMSTLKAGQHIHVPRTSEVPETQERLQEPIGQDCKRAKSVATTLGSGRYFSKVVQQLDSPEQGPHIVTRRTSCREPHQDDVRGLHAMFDTQKGISADSKNCSTPGQAS